MNCGMNLAGIVSLVALSILPAGAQSPEEMEERLDASAEVVQELLNAPDAEIPAGWLDDA